MSADASAPVKSTGEETAIYAMQLAERIAGQGWHDFESLAHEFGWKRSQLTAALRWFRRDASLYIVESKLIYGLPKVRITKVASKERQARQLSADIISQLVKLYANLKHTQRNREKLSQDVRAIVSRIGPFLENHEFQTQYRRLRRQLKDPEHKFEREVDYQTFDAPDRWLSDHGKLFEPKDQLHRTPLQRFDDNRQSRMRLVAGKILVGLVIATLPTLACLLALELFLSHIALLRANFNP